jgi:hypothetical protein
VQVCLWSENHALAVQIASLRRQQQAGATPAQGHKPGRRRDTELLAGYLRQSVRQAVHNYKITQALTHASHQAGSRLQSPHTRLSLPGREADTALPDPPVLGKAAEPLLVERLVEEGRQDNAAILATAAPDEQPTVAQNDGIQKADPTTSTHSHALSDVVEHAARASPASPAHKQGGPAARQSASRVSASYAQAESSQSFRPYSANPQLADYCVSGIDGTFPDLLPEQLTEYYSLGKTQSFTGDIMVPGNAKKAFEMCSFKREVIVMCTDVGDIWFEFVFSQIMMMQERGYAHIMVYMDSKQHCDQFQSCALCLALHACMSP